MSEPLAIVTVTFPRPVTGSELMAAVRALSDEPSASNRFALSQRYHDGDLFMIGQSSGSPDRHLCVVPSPELPWLRLDDLYDQVSVMSYAWSRSKAVQADWNTDSRVVDCVRSFAQRLGQYFATQHGHSEPLSVWPQEVTVCAHCGRIVTLSQLGSARCPEHGNNTATAKVSVTPATS